MEHMHILFLYLIIQDAIYIFILIYIHIFKLKPWRLISIKLTLEETVFLPQALGEYCQI